jgi:hypothetical protein
VRSVPPLRSGRDSRRTSSGGEAPGAPAVTQWLPSQLDYYLGPDGAIVDMQCTLHDDLIGFGRRPRVRYASQCPQRFQLGSARM